MTLRINRPVSTIWLDVTLLLVADPNQPSGIPRTTAELFRAWTRSGDTRLRLCRLDLKRHAYSEVPREGILARFQVTDGESDARPSFQTWLVAFARRTVARILKRFHELPIWFQDLVREVASGLETIQYHVRRWFGRPYSVPLQLGPSDIVVSLGGAWNYPHSGRQCRQLREQMGFRAVYFIHDLIPLKYPQLFREEFPPQMHRWVHETIPACDLILTNSVSTRRDLLAHCTQEQLPFPPVEVVRLGELAGRDDGVPPQVPGFDPAQPFVLSVGTLEVRKNHQLLYQAWRRLIEQHGNHVPRLVLVGSRGWLTGDLVYQIRNDPLSRGYIVLIKRCNDRQLRWLYRRCLFTLYPSHYEGWGLPIAESLAYGKYCIASNTSSMTEIDSSGQLVGHHDPCDLPTCLKLIVQAFDPAFRAEKEALIQRSYQRTSWDEAGRVVMAHLERYFGPTLRGTFEESRHTVVRSA
jgi:glycosyltransferase involved in cell wall biosynthesis